MVKTSKKIILTVFLITVFSVCLCAFSASAANEGPYVYEIKEGGVTITHCYPENISGDITIPEKLGGIPVVGIDDKAFYNCYSITSVTIHDNIKFIGERAFAHCWSLTKAILPDGLEEISDGTFEMCLILSDVTLSKTNIKQIGSRAFAGCEYLETATLPETLETVGEGAFEECGNLQSLIIGKNTGAIADNAFAKCYNLRNVYYMGTKDEFEKIAIGSGNETMFNFDTYFEHIHVYDDKAKISEGDCVIKGRTIYTCRCGDYYNEFAYGSHSYSNVITKATFKADGKTENKCKFCGDVKKTTVIPKIVAKLSKTAYAYTGKAISPTVTVKNTSGTALTKDKSYTAKYSSGRTEMGEYYVKVTLSGSKYSGSTKVYFNIIPGKATVTAISDSDSVTLNWNKVTGAKGYKVYSYNPETKKYKAIKTVSGTTYTIDKLECATNYTFTVRAYGKVNGETIWGNHSAVSTATAPVAVSLKSVTQKNATKATLSWSEIPADGYEIYMATGKNGKYKKVKTIEKGSTVSYTKSSLKAGTTYYFKIKAFKTVGEAKVYGEFGNVKTVSIK